MAGTPAGGRAPRLFSGARGGDGQRRRERPRGSADSQRMVWKEVRGRFSKLSPSRRQCSSRSSSGFTVPFMAPREPRAGTGAARPAQPQPQPQPELPALACGRTGLPGHRGAVHGELSRRPVGTGSLCPPLRGAGKYEGSRVAGLPAWGRDFWACGGSGGGGATVKLVRPENPASGCLRLAGPGSGSCAAVAAAAVAAGAATFPSHGMGLVEG